MNFIEIKIVDFGNGGYAASCKFEGQVFGSFEKADSLAAAEKNLRRNMYCQIYNAASKGLCRAYDKHSDKFIYTYSKFGAEVPAGLFAPQPAEKHLYELIETRDDNGIATISIRKHTTELLTESEIKNKLFTGCEK